MVNKANLWSSGNTRDWNFSQDYSGANIPGFEDTHILSCKEFKVTKTALSRWRLRSLETKKYDYGELVRNKEYNWELEMYVQKF